MTPIAAAVISLEADAKTLPPRLAAYVLHKAEALHALTDPLGELDEHAERMFAMAHRRRTGKACDPIAVDLSATDLDRAGNAFAVASDAMTCARVNARRASDLVEALADIARPANFFQAR